MRHANIQTTLAYYVDLSVAEMADELWATHRATPSEASGNISGNIGPKSANSDESPNAVTPRTEGTYYRK